MKDLPIKQLKKEITKLAQKSHEKLDGTFNKYNEKVLNVNSNIWTNSKHILKLFRG